MRNARFWVLYKGSPVKLTLRPGQKVETHFFSRNEEGFCSGSTIYDYDGVVVVRDEETNSRDCDGRYFDSCLTVCSEDRLRAGYRDIEGIRWPDWDKVKSSFRDFTAEAAGY